MPSILIPAHDEERVVGATLAAVLDGLGADVEVLVACNGCRDRTAEVARRFAPRVEVLEIATASKVAALNAAEARAPSFPRIYLDADIPIRGEHLMQITAALEQPGALAAEPRARFDLTGASALVRAYYAVWRALHGSAPGDVGGGLYALSAAGRARFGEFPDVIADDGYVRAHFLPGEIRHVESAESVVRTPRTVSDLVRIKTRSKRGALELARRFPELWANKRRAGPRLRQKLARLPLRLWPLVPLYVLLQGWIQRRARRQDRARGDDAFRWERDRSTR
ncbi:MAG: glycosyltransferase [Planctomycetes bacterium]|nr:glycosyltransferase [Planctomycetota bacterium]